MKLKSLMLGAAAAAAATSAQAADLPVAPEPVDYVRICDAYGAQFYYIPGTETCLRVGGRIRSEVTVNNVLEDGNWGDRDSDGYRWRNRGYIYLDARTATEFGTLRAYSSIYGTVDNADSDSFTLDKAYIQWGGLTVGHVNSNFDIYTEETFMNLIGGNWSDVTLNQIAYTASFGNGFSVTAALEDRSGREYGNYGGTRAPDGVLALALTQGWGSAQLSGALHQVYPDTASAFQTGTSRNGAEDKLGWALGGGVKVNLPMITPGSELFFQGFYADGALAYITTDDIVADFNGDDTSTGYSLSAGAYVQATSTIGLALTGSYLDVDAAEGLNDVKRYTIEGSAQWEPVSGLILGGNVAYGNTNFDTEPDTDELLFGARIQRTF